MKSDINMYQLKTELGRIIHHSQIKNTISLSVLEIPTWFYIIN